MVWVETNLTLFGLDKKYYYEALLKVVEDLPFKKKTQYVKLRQKQKASESPIVEVLKKKGITVKCLPNDLIMECVLAISKNCTLIGIVSSVLFYGSKLGHKSFSIYDLLENRPKTIFDDWDFLWNRVEKFDKFV